MGKCGALVFTFSLIAFCCPIGWPKHTSSVSDLKESQGKSMQQKEQANLNLWRFPLWECCPLLHHQGMRDLMIYPHPGLKWSQEHACYQIDHLMPVLYTSSNGELLGYLRRRTFETSPGWREDGRGLKSSTNINFFSELLRNISHLHGCMRKTWWIKL